MKVKPYDGESTSKAGLSSGAHLCLLKDILALDPSLVNEGREINKKSK